nr:hypothetical protein [Planotetraspora silvatica]
MVSDRQRLGGAHVDQPEISLNGARTAVVAFRVRIVPWCASLAAHLAAVQAAELTDKKEH